MRRLDLADMDEAACVFRRSFDQAMPSLKGLHTPAEDRAFFCRMRNVGRIRSQRDEGVHRLSRGLDRPALCAVARAGAGRWFVPADGGAKVFRQPPTLDISAQLAGAAVLRSSRIFPGP